MSEWNLKDSRRMIYHHMMEEIMYHEDDIETLREKLVEKYRNHKLDEREINRVFGAEVDTVYMREFWEKRAKTHVLNEALTNLEDDTELLRLKMQKEMPKMHSYINPNKKMSMLDLGSGYGTWAFNFAKDVKLVHAVDYIEDMVKLGRKRAKDEKITNIKFFESSVQDFPGELKYDLVLLSGICLYLNDADMRQMLKKMKNYTKPGTILILREGTGLKERYVIEKEYSKRLHTMYSATYRTGDEYMQMFGKVGFELIKDEDMFEEKSPLNKYKETRLRIYKFIRRANDKLPKRLKSST